MSKTEQELVDKLKANWTIYFPGVFISVESEYQTPLGDVDLVGITSDLYYVVEVKRKKVTLKDVTQLLRYIEHFSMNKKKAIGYIAAPAIGIKAYNYLSDHKLMWLEIDFDKVKTNKQVQNDIT